MCDIKRERFLPDQEPSLMDEQSLYTTLQLSKDCTEEQIKDNYRRLSRLFHPDKQQDSRQKQLAQSKFQEIQHAMDVLSDPRRKKLYDTFGDEGVQVELQIQKRDTSLEDLEAQVKKLLYKKRLEYLDSQVRSRTEIKSLLNLTPLFADKFLLVEQDSKQIISIPWFLRPWLCGLQGLSCKHSFMVPLSSENSTVGFDFKLSSSNKQLYANFLSTFRHSFASNKLVEFSLHPLYPRNWEIKYSQTYKESSCFMQSNGSLLDYPPIVNCKISTRITKYGSASIGYNSGYWCCGNWGSFIKDRGISSQYVLGWTHLLDQSARSYLIFQVLSSPTTCAFVTEYQFPIITKDTALHGELQVNISTVGQSLSALLSRNISEFTKISLGFSFSVNSGALSLKFIWDRLGQKIVIPIALCTSYNSNAVTFGFLTPFTVLAIYEYFVRIPSSKRKRKQRLKEQSKAKNEEIKAARLQALETIELLTPIASSKLKKEEKENGLILSKAHYGSGENSIDVLVPLTSLISDSQLVIKGGFSKVSMLFLNANYSRFCQDSMISALDKKNI